MQDINQINNSLAEGTADLADVSTPRNDTTIEANYTKSVSPFPVPIATNEDEFESNHIVVTVDGLDGGFYFWQNGGALYYSLDGTFNTTQLMTNIAGTGKIVISEVDSKPWVVGEIDVEV